MAADAPTFGRFITEARKKLNMSQKELTAKILREDGESISPQYLNDIRSSPLAWPPRHAGSSLQASTCPQWLC
jgi:hypothetical protein